MRIVSRKEAKKQRGKEEKSKRGKRKGGEDAKSAKKDPPVRTCPGGSDADSSALVYLHLE